MAVMVLVVDDEPDVEALFRQQFRRELRAERFVLDFAASAPDALRRVANATEQAHYLRVYMAHLRRKLETDAARPRYLLTEAGVGYRLAAE